MKKAALRQGSKVMPQMRKSNAYSDMMEIKKSANEMFKTLMNKAPFCYNFIS